MNRTDAVKTEVRKLAESKPVHAAAGAGALTAAALRELPARISRWSSEMPRATWTTARTKAVKEYDKLAVHGAAGAAQADRAERQERLRRGQLTPGLPTTGLGGSRVWFRFPPGPDSLTPCC